MNDRILKKICKRITREIPRDWTQSDCDWCGTMVFGYWKSSDTIDGREHDFITAWDYLKDFYFHAHTILNPKGDLVFVGRRCSVPNVMKWLKTLNDGG